MKRLYVGNLPFSAVEEQIQTWFVQIGITPSAVNLVRDRLTAQSRGFAFVELSNDEDATRAVAALNGQNFGGRDLVVNEARPQAERPATGRAGGGRNSPGAGGRSGGASRRKDRDSDDNRGNR